MSVTERDRRRYRLENENIDEKCRRAIKNSNVRKTSIKKTVFLYGVNLTSDCLLDGVDSKCCSVLFRMQQVQGKHSWEINYSTTTVHYTHLTASFPGQLG